MSEELLLTDAPIREGIPENSLCGKCTKLLWVDGCKKYKRSYHLENGFAVIDGCSGFVNYETTEPMTP